MATGETSAHGNLKQLATGWAQQQGYAAVGTEVRVPKSGYRADVAAYRSAKDSLIGVTAMFECKQARSDFLKDSYASEATATRLKELDARRQKLESLLKLHVPTLRAGESLFAEFDAVDLRGFEHKSYRTVMREIERLQRRLYGKTKFDKVVRYRCANLNYLVVEEAVLAPHEVPAGWGLLVHRADQLVLERKPVWQDAAETDRLALLHRIAIAGTRRLNREIGIALDGRE